MTEHLSSTTAQPNATRVTPDTLQRSGQAGVTGDAGLGLV